MGGVRQGEKKKWEGARKARGWRWEEIEVVW